MLSPAEQRIYECLYPNNPKAVAWAGSKTVAELVEETGYSPQTVRAALRHLYRLDLACAFAPHKWDRADGRTAAARVWLRGTEDPGFPNPKY